MFDAAVLPGLKAVLATVLVVLAVYQVLLMLVGYGKLRIRVLSGRAAAHAHRAIGDTVLAAALVIAALCISSFGAFQTYQTRVAVHSLAGWGLVALLVVLWATSALSVLGG